MLRFLELLEGALATQRAYVVTSATKDDAPHRAERVGWIVDGNLFLEPDSAFACVQKFARDQGENIPLTLATLQKRLYERGYLLSTERDDKGTRRYQVKKTVSLGQRLRVLHLPWPLQKVGQVGQVGPEGVDLNTKSRSDALLWRPTSSSWPGETGALATEGGAGRTAQTEFGLTPGAPLAPLAPLPGNAEGSVGSTFWESAFGRSLMEAGAPPSAGDDDDE